MISPQALRRPLRSAVLVVFAIWLSVGLLVWWDRVEARRSAGRLTESITRSTAQRVDAALRDVDRMLLDIGGKVTDPVKLDDAALLALMRNRGAVFSEVFAVFVVDADGIVRHSTLSPLQGSDLHHRNYFQAIKAGQGLTLTEPLLNPTLGRIGVLLARPLVGRLGSFDGIVVAALDPGFFLEMLSGTLSVDVDRSVIATRNGDVLAKLPDQDGGSLASIRSGPLFTRYLPSARSGTFTAESAFDGRSRLASYIASDRFPVVVSVGVTVETALRRWSVNAAAIAAAGAVFSLIVLLIALQLERRGKAARVAVEALALSEGRYRRLIEDQTDLIHHYLPDTTLIFCNRAYAEFYGATPEALNGRKWLDFIPAAEHEEVLGILRGIRPSAPSREDRRRVVRPGQPDRWIEWRTTGQFDAYGVSCGFHTIGRDVTDATLAQQAIAEREELYRQIFHCNMTVKLLIDPSDGRIVDANQSAAQFYGYPVDVLTTMRITSINTLPAAEVKAEMEAVERGERLFLRFKHRIASGALRDVEVYSSPLHGGGRSYLSSIVVDVTERNRFEAELATKSAELERSNADLEQFAYVASHDLRQPLRMVSSYITLLARSLAGRLSPDEAEFMGYAVHGVKHMDALILGLLEYSRVGRGDEASEAVDLNDAVDSAAASLGLDGPDSRATLAVDRPLPTVTGVRGELVRLFQNLIGNALKYRDPVRPPRIEIGSRKDDGEWVVWVQDNGIGIAPEYSERIFKIFQRLHAESKIEGTGIGLSICRKIAHSHGGRIWVESEPGQGSRFLVAFPAVDGGVALRESVAASQRS
ncbi:MAG: PAS domain S-box protein [Phaeospirillum sp.]|nr:PAS domain S-box protein [Phaeospirillum sp.]